MAKVMDMKFGEGVVEFFGEDLLDECTAHEIVSENAIETVLLRMEELSDRVDNTDFDDGEFTNNEIRKMWSQYKGGILVLAQMGGNIIHRKEEYDINKLSYLILEMANDKYYRKISRFQKRIVFLYKNLSLLSDAMNFKGIE